MNNLNFWKCISKYPEHENRNGEELFCDKMVKNGLGQTVDGYLKDYYLTKYIDYKECLDKAEPSQKFHFWYYYINVKDRRKNNPTYNSLHCPQLMMYIAEMAGLKKSILEKAYNYLEQKEIKKEIKETEKNGRYLSNNNIETEFKNALRIYQINRIIKNAESYKKILDEVGKID